MAFVVKNIAGNRFNKTLNGGQAVLSQWIQVSRPTLALPQTTTQQLFRVFGGRVHIRLMTGEVTTVIEGTDPVAKVSFKALTDAGVANGTAYDIASTLDMSSDEVGTLYGVEGDGTAITSGGQVAGTLETFGNGWVAAQGEIYLTTGASKTGAIKWDLWYQPLDSGAYVTSVNAATAAI